MGNHVADALTTLLEHERSVVKSGDFNALRMLSAEKETLLTALASEDVPQAHLSMLAQHVEENQSLLTAAMRGVGAAQKRMAILDQVRTGSNVYSKSGEVTRMTSENPKHQRKA